VTRLLTVEEVAERLGMTKDWVWAQARAGRIPHVQLGRYRRFREEAIERWLEELEAELSLPEPRRKAPGASRRRRQTAAG
jgi:excisionase family DNA binding protein